MSFKSNKSNEMYVHFHDDDEILERISQVDWVNYMIPYDSVIANDELDLYSILDKYRNFNNFFNADKKTKISFYFYDPSSVIFVDGDLKPRTITRKIGVLLEEKFKNVFFVNQRIIDLSLIFDAIDNPDRTKTIYEVDTLRAKRIRKIQGFYDTTIKYFLSLICDYIYESGTLKLTGIDISDAAIKAGKIVLSAMKEFEKDLKNEYNGDAIYEQIEDSIPKPEVVEKKVNKASKKRTKKSKVLLEESKN